MNNGLNKAELWSNVLCTLEELEIDLADLHESDDISAGESKSISAMKRKLATFKNYGIIARAVFWQKTEGGAK